MTAFSPTSLAIRPISRAELEPGQWVRSTFRNDRTGSYLIQIIQVDRLSGEEFFYDTRGQLHGIASVTLELLAEAPRPATELAAAKVEALREAADALHYLALTKDELEPWLRTRAQLIEEDAECQS